MRALKAAVGRGNKIHLVYVWDDNQVSRQAACGSGNSSFMHNYHNALPRGFTNRPLTCEKCIAIAEKDKVEILPAPTKFLLKGVYQG